MGEQNRDDGQLYVFREKAIGELEDALHVNVDDKLKLALNELCTTYRPIAKSVPSKLAGAPSNKDLSKQIQWFKNNTINPAQTLLKALTVDAHEMRTAMTPELDKLIDTEHLVPALEKLLDQADEVYVEMDQQLYHRIKNKQQIQYEVVLALYNLFDNNLGNDFAKRGTATVDLALHIACGEVLQHKEQINSIVKAVRLQASKR